MTPFEDGLRGGRVGVDGSGKVVATKIVSALTACLP